MSRDKARGYDKYGKHVDPDTKLGPHGPQGVAYSIATHDNPPPGSADDGVNSPSDGQFRGRGILNLYGGDRKLKVPPKGHPDYN